MDKQADVFGDGDVEDLTMWCTLRVLTVGELGFHLFVEGLPTEPWIE